MSSADRRWIAVRDSERARRGGSFEWSRGFSRGDLGEIEWCGVWAVGVMEYAGSFFEGRGSKWNYDSLKNFNQISTPVQHHLQRVS